MCLPNEIIDCIFMYCDSADINRWKDFEKMSSVLFLKKRTDNIIEAGEKGYLECVKYLAKFEPIEYLNYVLRWSAGHGQLDIVRYLVSIGADIRADDFLALKWSAQAGQTEMVKYLISLGADIDCALKWSADGGHLEIVKYLIGVGADYRVDENYIYRLAYGRGDTIFMKYLISL